MKVFLSWSGKLSRDIAVALDEWLPYVIQAVKPFVSAGDIDKGDRWGKVLADELAQIGFGIIIVTRENRHAPWIHFEAGAISKALDKSSVSPLLFGVDAAKLDGPLQQFEATIYEQDDIFSLLRSINARLEAGDQVPYDVLRNEFDAWWPKLKTRLDGILAAQPFENETGYEWLYTTTDLSRHMDKPQQVWIVAPHLYRNALVPPVRDVINQNLHGGAVYTFVICQGEDATELRRMANAAPGQIRIVELEEHEFQSVAVTDYFILEPDTDAIVLLELPLQVRGYWIPVDREAAVGLVERFRKYINQSLAAAKPAASGPA